MKALFHAAFLALLLLTLDASAITTMAVTLDGPDWRIAADPNNTGRENNWFNGPTQGAAAAHVPGALQEFLPGAHGVIWYWRTFDAPAMPFDKGRYLLRFGAVDYLAEVWVNDTNVGGHEGSETPFSLDVTNAILPNAANRIAVRVLNPTDTPIDGIVLKQTAHRNKNERLTVGGSYNVGGIMESVELLLTPVVRISDVHVQPDWKTGAVHIETTLVNAGDTPATGHLEFMAGPYQRSEINAAFSTPDAAIAPGVFTIQADLTVPQVKLWSLETPNLYSLSTWLAVNAPAACTDENNLRFGFKDFRVERGFFRLNGKRIFLKSSHTGNHAPIDHTEAPECAPDLLRKDLYYMKSVGFNCVRFIAGVARPYQLDLCDELGLLVYEECLAGWCLEDSPKMQERFTASLHEMILRDRNHACLGIVGFLNETPDGPVFRHAVASLPDARALDPMHLMLLQSGRWDGQWNIGSVSNPGSNEWEYEWGAEAKDSTERGTWGMFGGYFTGAGDAHVYPGTPHTPEIENGIRTLGNGTKPVFLSEYGIGSLMNAIGELRHYEQYGVNPALDDYQYFKNTEDRLTADWNRLGFDQVYATPQEMLRDSQRLHCRQRTLGFNLIRSNPNICGYNLTGLLDHGFTGEGLWTFWREFKPGIMDVLQDGLSPLRWCLFASPMNEYQNEPVTLEAVLANEDVLKPGTYPVELRVVGPNGVSWEQSTECVIPAVADGADGPLAVPVFKGDMRCDPPGEYTFTAEITKGAAPMGGHLKFNVTGEPSARVLSTVAAVSLTPDANTWLEKHGIPTVPLQNIPGQRSQIILVGNPGEKGFDLATFRSLLEQIARGSVAIFLAPEAFKHGDNPVALLPLKNKGTLTAFPDWLYHKECVAMPGPGFYGLPAHGVLDWEVYGQVISNKFFEGQDTPALITAAAFAICHSSRPDGYAAGTMIAEYPFGEGAFLLNTFNILDNLGKHPAADQMLTSFVFYASPKSKKPATDLPANFADLLKEIQFPE